jgi:ATP-dependent Clp protease protease subunit
MDIAMKNYLENADGSRVDFNDISLESLGSHMLFGGVDNETIRESVGFILKANQIFQPTRDISLFINTIGGDCYDGFALIDVMAISKMDIKTIGLGNILSMGVLILCAGTKGKRYMTKNTQVMAHQFYDDVGGKFHEIASAYKANLYLEQQFIQHFKTHTSMNEKQIKEVLFGPSDRWLSPSECKKFGLIDHIIDELPDFNKGHQTPSTSSKSGRRAH